MRCPRCNAENQSNAKFCVECGAAFRTSCVKCGFDNPPSAKFCQECGAGLCPPVLTLVPEVSSAQKRESGERRHLTVLFCDLVGSTAIAAELDPEEWCETVARYQRAVGEAITRFGGYVAKYLGDGLMAFFGYPEAHDNDAERAGRAGLAILEAIAKLNEQAERPKLAARVGIDSGWVVVGAGAGTEVDVFGDAPKIAARAQEAANPGTVVVTEDTHRLISGLFVVQRRGAATLKGIERPIQLYGILRPSGVRGRLKAAAASHGLTPFVGRVEELRLLMNRWERAVESDGQVALIIGEAGIGKSRLIHRFHEQIVGKPHTWIETAAAPFFLNTPFYPVAEMFRELLAWRGDESAEEQLARLEPALALAGLKPDDALPLLAPVLNLPTPAKYPPTALSPDQSRRRLLATLVEIALGAAQVQPTVITMEDLQWADPSTLELIQLLVEQGARARLLLLYTARSEFKPLWPLRGHHTHITLTRLSSREARTMLERVAARRALSEETVAVVIERTGGVPLFVEELTHAVLEREAQSSEREIPVTLRDSLMARLDRLGPAKEILQVGAVIGGEFSYRLLHTVHPIAEEDLQRALRALADAELLYARGIAPEATYLFKHALIRDAAYQALLKSRRKELHRLVAQTIDEKFPSLKDVHPEVLARHWTEADEPEPAITQWSVAGQAAEGRSAFKEALESYQQALALLNTLPESPERDLRELEFRQSVLFMLFVGGYSAAETVDAAMRFGALAEKSGKLAQLSRGVAARAAHAFVAGDPAAAAALAHQALDLALREGSPASLGMAHNLQILTRYRRGDLAGVEKHFATGLAFFGDPGLKQISGSVAVSSFGTASHNAWALSLSDVARERESQMLTAANVNNPYEVALSRQYTAQLRLYMREYHQAAALAARALELSEKHKFGLLAAISQCFLGEARAQLGHTAEGLRLIQQGIQGLLEGGSRVTVELATYLAAAQEHEGAIPDALATLEEALQANPDELIYRPEALRLRGELQLKQAQTELAAADFQEAVALARSMGAKALELRATMSLARLLAKQGTRDEARTMLGEIYNRFTEGFDTADLKDAKALLDELES